MVMFCGHREISETEKIKSWLFEVVEECIKAGEKEFWYGGYGAFDFIAATVIWELKQKYPQIKLVLVLPYLNQNIRATKYDETIYPDLENIPPRYAIIHRNRWMAEKADIVIAFVQYDWGGAAQMLRYAAKKQKKIIQYQNK